jgi:hypothetical protein
MTGPRDRASAVTTALLQIISAALHNPELRRRIEDVLRDEFADERRQVMAEEQPGD